MIETNALKKRKKGGLIALLGLALIAISPFFLIPRIFILTIVLAILGCVVLFFGISLWKKSMHEMRVSHVDIHAGKVDTTSDVGVASTSEIDSKKTLSGEKIVLLGLAAGFLGFLIYQVLFNLGLSYYIKVAYLYSDFLYL